MLSPDLYWYDDFVVFYLLFGGCNDDWGEAIAGIDGTGCKWALDNRLDEDELRLEVSLGGRKVEMASNSLSSASIIYYYAFWLKRSCLW